LTPIVRTLRHDLAAPADDGLRHSGKPEHGSDRCVDVCNKLRTIGGDIQNLAFVTLNAKIERYPGLMLPGSAK
jgi:hypothetical protein